MKHQLSSCPVWNTPYQGDNRRLRGPVSGRLPIGDPEARNGFMRGFIAAGLVAATAGNRPARKEALRLALQGGTAMAAGIATANALDRRDYGAAIIAVIAGAAGLRAINHLSPESPSRKKEEENDE